MAFIQSTERRVRRFRKSQQSSVLRSALLSSSFQTADHGTPLPPLLRESIIKVNLISLYIFQFYIDTNSHAWETVHRGGRKSQGTQNTAVEYCHLDVAWLLHTQTQLFWFIVYDLHTIKTVKNFSLEWGWTPEIALVAEKLLAVDCWGMKRHFWEYGP